VRQLCILSMDHWRRVIPLFSALSAVGITLGGLLIGQGTVGHDPDREFRIFRFIRAEELRQGRIPYWSDRFGLGVPLIAESQVAAFYPPNLLFDRAFDALTAYDLAAWSHYLFLTAAVYVLARVLGLAPWGAALAGVAFALSGQLSGHLVHEPFYEAIPFLVLILAFTERYLGSGRFFWLGLLALSFGVSLTIGHFQYQFYAVLAALFLGVWRVWRDQCPRLRLVGLMGALAWGGAIAAIQLFPTSEFALLGSLRTGDTWQQLIQFKYPLTHWMEVAFPLLFDRTDLEFLSYWRAVSTNHEEACFYFGTIPLILALAGLLARRRDRSFAPWLALGLAGIALNIAARHLTPLYFLLTRLPGFGEFRCPARYMIYPTLTLCLLAGAGFDRGLDDRTFRRGMIIGGIVFLLAVAWAVLFSFLPSKRPYFWNDHLVTSLAWGGLAWAIGILAIMVWHRGWVGCWMPFAVAAVELGLLFHANCDSWGPHVRIPQDSPVFQRLQAEPEVRRVAGELFNIPVRASLIPAKPYNSLFTHSQWLFESATRQFDAADRLRLYRRFGVTHGILPLFGPEMASHWHNFYARPTDVSGSQSLGEFEDEALSLTSGWRAIKWVVFRYPGTFPPARIVQRWHEVNEPEEAIQGIARSEEPGEGWIVAKDYPADLNGPRAKSARVLEWDGSSGTVEHDGPCDLVLDRAYYRGWFAKVGDKRETPVFRADACVQGIHLDGYGRTSVSVFYRPTWFIPGVVLSATSLVALLLALTVSALRHVSGRQIRPDRSIPIHDGFR
jgi:hypothetical protein